MEALLSKVTQQAMSIAIRSGISITSGFAIQQCSRLLKNVDRSNQDRTEIAILQARLESKIRIISPAIDMIELIAARGNTSLESAVTLTKGLRWDIQSLGMRLQKAASGEEAYRKSRKAQSRQGLEDELKLIAVDMKRLLEKIEDAVPLINLAITTSGVNLSTTLPSSVSPSRLLQASTFLTAGDSRYAMKPNNAVQIGPIFTLSMYMLFSSHSNRPHDEEGVREATWKEVMHKARLKLLRVPLDVVHVLPKNETGHFRHKTDDFGQAATDTDIPSVGKAYEFAYQLVIIEDLEDDRIHTFEEDQPQPGPFGGVGLAGIREALPIHQISKIFYADTGKILNIGADGESNNPILLLKRDVDAIPPRRMMDRESEESGWEEPDDVVETTEANKHDRSPHSKVEVTQGSSNHGSNAYELQEHRDWLLPPGLDPEWIAFEVYTEAPDSDDEKDSAQVNSSSAQVSTPNMMDDDLQEPELSGALANLNLHSSSSISSSQQTSTSVLMSVPQLEALAQHGVYNTAPTTLPPLRTSLSLLELLIRLTALQQFQQQSHLAITDELLNFFLSEAGTTGAGGDAETRRRVRREARTRVGFDPYDESPVKRRGEEYLQHYGESQDGSMYEGVGASDGARTPLTDPRYEPRLARGWSEGPASLGRRSPMRAGRRSTPGVESAASSPGLGPMSPLARKSAGSKSQARPLTERLKESRARASPLSRNEADSALGTSPASG